ncbi:AMP-binding protein [Rhodoferax sp.]|uniref:AMP-binding protein n=1 Tax=Rhodoferax sp. TaxID=50421 RepID=UPI00345B7140
MTAQAPATLMVNDALPMIDRLVDFLGIIASGRCAAVADPEWPAPVRQSVSDAMPTAAADLPAPRPESAFYVGYTSGSSGTPKGYRRDHRSWTSSFRACLDEFGPDAGRCILAPGKESNSLFLFGMLLALWSGAGVVVQAQFSAARALDTLGSGLTPCLVAVPSQLMLMVEVAKRRGAGPIDAVRLILISGSRWIRARTAELRALFPCARIIEFYGASETSFIAWMDTDDTAPMQVVGRPFKNVEVQIRDVVGDELSDSGQRVGLIYVRSPMVFMGYVGGAADDTAALRDGDWLCVRDQGYLDALGRLCLAGRQSRMIVTKGKNLFAEELETVLAMHPAFESASVHGVNDALRGRQIVAILKPRQGGSDAPFSALQLVAWCRQSLEAYKAPRQFFVCHNWCLTPSGKTDHRALAKLLHHHLEAAVPPSSPCLTPLR